MTHGDGRRDAAAAKLLVHDVTKRYGRLRALDQVSLTVNGGEIVAVVGENGAGKSTLVRCIAGDIDADEGRIELFGSSDPSRAGATVLSVLWQDLGLCEDLDVLANIFLGREPGRVLLAEGRMAERAAHVLGLVGAQLHDLRARVDTLSRGERQEVALARSLVTDADVLVLDEPTVSLSVMRRGEVVRVLRDLRDEGRAILLVSHDLDEVFALADRILVLRHGRIVATASPAEVSTDDVTAMMSGIETESMARRQLNRLKSLVEQLSAADPAASLPIVVSATSAALDQDALCVHLLEPGSAGPVLRRTAAVGLPPNLLESTDVVPVGVAGGPVGTAAEAETLIVIDDIRDDPGETAYVSTAGSNGVRSIWSAPIVGNSGVLGTITGFGMSAGRLDPDRAELISLYAGHAATALEREALERATHDAAAARRSQHLQRTFLQRLSHELRTPLTAIRGYASTLQQPDLTWDAASTDRFLSAITTESARMERLVGDLLDSSAIESGLLRLRRDWTDLKLVLEAAHAVAPRRDAIRLSVDAGLEPIWADHDRLEQLFVNLLENAVRHGGQNGITDVRVAVRQDDGVVEVSVIDNGPGIPQGVADKIFEPRVRGNSSSGAGLGLAIARGIAEAHGGTCELVPGAETTFRVRLPIEPVDDTSTGVDGTEWQGLSDHG